MATNYYNEMLAKIANLGKMREERLKAQAEAARNILIAETAKVRRCIDDWLANALAETKYETNNIMTAALATFQQQAERHAAELATARSKPKARPQPDAIDPDDIDPDDYPFEDDETPQGPIWSKIGKGGPEGTGKE